jgi:hypothetical protein
VCRNRVVAVRLRRGAPLVLATILFAVVGCSGSTRPPITTAVAGSTAVAVPANGRVGATMMDDSTVATAGDRPAGAQPQLAVDPVQLADDLVADEQALRDPSTPEAVLVAAARRQQAAYRAIGRHPDWDAVTRPRIPPSLLEDYDRNIDARRQLTAMAHVKDTLPAWRIDAPAPAEELLGDYREAESVSGVGWNYLAAINLIETRFGSIDGVSAAGAQGPMQFLPPRSPPTERGATSTRPTTASWRLAATWPPMALPTIVITPSTATTTPTNTCRRSTTTQQCLPPTPQRSPATTVGTSTTTRPPVTCCSRSVTPRRHRSPLATTWRPTRSKSSGDETLLIRRLGSGRIAFISA